MLATQTRWADLVPADPDEERAELLRHWLCMPHVPRDLSPLASVDDDLSQVERNILAAATEVPCSSKRLVRAAGYKFNSYTGSAITELCRRRLLLRTPDGLSLP